MLNRLVDRVSSQQGNGATAETSARQTTTQYAVHLSGRRHQRVELRGRDLIIVAQRVVALVHQSAESLEVALLERFRGVKSPLNLRDYVTSSPYNAVGRVLRP